MDLRLERGRALASGGKVRQAPDGTWVVLSSSHSRARYLVNPDPLNLSCTCHDFRDWELPCKHIYAVRLFTTQPQNEIIHEDKPMPAGPTTTAATAPKKPTYKQDWSAYNKAQILEKDLFEILLRDLCNGVVDRPSGTGRPRLPLGDVIYACCLKVYTEKSGRRASSELRASASKGLLKRPPHHNSISRYLSDLRLNRVLTQLIEEAAAPLTAVESQFAADATGFGTKTYERWLVAREDESTKKRRDWVKCHIMVGTTTNVVTTAVVTPGTTADSPLLPELLAGTARRFAMSEVSADKGYLSGYNLMAIEAHGAEPYVMFKVNSTANGPSIVQRMYHMFWFRRDEYLKHYHRRSNVESTFSAIKRKFGDAVRSKGYTAQANETLCKVLCHNIVVLIHEMHELGIKIQLGDGPVRSADLVDP